ncbi:type II secretion system ATPase GspE [bacterium]|jgi:general secretion pathway protein E/type IV pilus assembly protein PilB|nr:type II secretion system ATPase GspE [bacterium]
MTQQSDYIASILMDVGLVDEESVEKAKEHSVKTGKSFQEALVELGLCREIDILKALAVQFGMEFIQLSDIDIPKDIIKLIPPETAKKYKIVPIKKKGDTLTVALFEPTDADIFDNLSFVLKCNIEGVVATKEDILAALDKYYGVTEETVDKMIAELSEGDITFLDEKTRNAEEEGVAEEAPVIKLVSLLILEAFKMRSSDIHLEPLERKFRVRYRIDGVLHEMQSPPKRLQGSIISRIKIMSNMSIAEKRLPQDGRIKINLMGKEIDLRVSSLPANHGESVVLRLLDKSSLLLGLSELGFFADDQETFESLIALPNGILLITGPTGSGKTTTLYGALNYINRPDRKIITVEDPVEYMLSGINQVQVNEDIGLTFANVLRSILRQAPNVIMIGEIRDIETANIAVQASLTGHLVFSTLHTNDSSGAITRLIDQGVKPFLVASSVQAILAQRLVRKICNACKQEYKPSEYEMSAAKLDPEKIKDMKFYKGAGCSECNNTGYRGRIGIYELLIVNDEIRKMIYQKCTSGVIRQKAREVGMRTLREDGIRKVLGGITTLDEVFRITQMDIE